MGFGIATQTGVSAAIQSIPSLSTNCGLRNGYSATFYENFVDGTNTLDPRITFSRASNATVTGSNGLIQYAPHNLLTFSEQFDNAAWGKTAVTVTANATTAPDGTRTADLCVPTTAVSGHNFTQTITPSANVTVSVYVKPSGYTTFIIRNGAQTIGSDFTGIGSTNTVTNAGGAVGSITAVGDGWFRLVVNFNSAQQPWFFIDSRGSYAGDGVSGFFVWGAQLEIGSTATAYNPTTVKNLLGFSEAFDNAAWTKSNSFIQTNLLTFSEQFDNAAWSAASSGTYTVAANTAVAPNGTTTADVLTTSATGSVFVTQVPNLPSIASYTMQGWVRLVSGSGTAAINIGGNQSTPVTLTNQWTLLTHTVSVGSAGLRQCSFVLPNSAQVALWGAQLVQGSVAGDYQQTTSAALPVMYQAPNGTMTADKLVENTVNQQHYVQAGVTVTSGTVYTISAYVKAGERSRVNLLLAQSTSPFTNHANVTFDLLTGTVSATTAGTGSITAVGNGWYRVAAVAAATTSTGVLARITTALTNNSDVYTGDGTSGIYIWGAQLSDSASLDPYVNNPVAAPSSTAYYGPRFDYDSAGLSFTEQLGSELVTNGNFSSGTTGWTPNANATISVSSGALVIANATAGTADCRAGTLSGFTTVIGRSYKVEGTVVSASGYSGTVSIAAGNTSTGSTVSNQMVAIGGQASFFFTATATTTYVFAAVGSLPVGATFTIDNISVKEYQGLNSVGSAAPRGLLIEEQRSNLCLQSEALDNASWTKAQSAVTANAAVSPDGRLSADLWVPTTSGNTNNTRLLATIAVSNATAYTASVYVKSAGRRWAFFAAPDASANSYNCWFDLQNGVVGTKGASVTSASIMSVGNGWYRISATSTSTNTTNYVFISSTDADNSTTVTADGNGLYVWGAQLEAGAFATSYIPTTSAQVTRSADVAVIQGSNFNSWFNVNEGSFYTQNITSQYANVPISLTLTNGVTTYGFNVGGSGSSRWYNGTTNLASSNSVSVNNFRKEAFSYTSNTRNICLNNGTVNSDANVPFAATPIRMIIGSDANTTGQFLNGYIRQIAYYPRRLSNQELVAITS